MGRNVLDHIIAQTFDFGLHSRRYGVATISRLLKIIGLFYRILSLL